MDLNYGIFKAHKYAARACSARMNFYRGAKRYVMSAWKLCEKKQKDIVDIFKEIFRRGSLGLPAPRFVKFTS